MRLGYQQMMLFAENKDSGYSFLQSKLGLLFAHNFPTLLLTRNVFNGMSSKGAFQQSKLELRSSSGDQNPRD